MKYARQVEPSHYKFGDYLKLDRWISYFHQLSNLAFIQTKLSKDSDNLSILEIGPGDKTVSTILKSKGFHIKTMDVAEDIKPDIVSALPNIPATENFDCIICCEVLEHIKYEDVVESLANMSERGRFAIISIPHKSFYCSFTLRLSLLKPLKLMIQAPTLFIKHNFNGEHYWELGTKGYSEARFRKTITSSGFRILKNHRVTEYPYHHFFVLESTNI